MKSKAHLYIGILACLFIILGTLQLAFALPTQDATFQPGPNTDSPEIVELTVSVMHEAGDILNGSSGTEKPSMDSVVAPAYPNGTPGVYTLAQWANLVAKQKAHMMALAIKAGILKEGAKVKFLKSPRSAQEDLKFYALSIKLHYQAISENLPGDFYVKLLSENPDYAKKLPQLLKDLDACGSGFLLYPESNPHLCSQAPNWLEAERNHKAAKDTIDVLKIEIDKLKGYYYALESHYNAAKDSIAAWFNEAQFWKAKAKKGKR